MLKALTDSKIAKNDLNIILSLKINVLHRYVNFIFIDIHFMNKVK